MNFSELEEETTRTTKRSQSLAYLALTNEWRSHQIMANHIKPDDYNASDWFRTK